MTTKTDITRTYYLTKYALTGGIVVAEGAPSTHSPECIKVAGDYNLYKMGRDVFETEAEAIANAEARRAKKVAALKKQIAKLEKMTIKVKS